MKLYRIFGGGRYHRARADFIRSGRAVCGANIAHPAYSARSVAEVERAGRRVCGHCARGMSA